MLICIWISVKVHRATVSQGARQISVPQVSVVDHEKIVKILKKRRKKKESPSWKDKKSLAVGKVPGTSPNTIPFFSFFSGPGPSSFVLFFFPTRFH